MSHWRTALVLLALLALAAVGGRVLTAAAHPESERCAFAYDPPESLWKGTRFASAAPEGPRLNPCGYRPPDPLGALRRAATAELVRRVQEGNACPACGGAVRAAGPGRADQPLALHVECTRCSWERTFLPSR